MLVFGPLASPAKIEAEIILERAAARVAANAHEHRAGQPRTHAALTTACQRVAVRCRRLGVGKNTAPAAVRRFTASGMMASRCSTSPHTYVDRDYAFRARSTTASAVRSATTSTGGPAHSNSIQSALVGLSVRCQLLSK